MYVRTEGIIIKRRNFGEADRIVTIYTRDYGKLTAIVKGVRRPRSKKAGHLELGNWCKVFIAKGKNLDLLTEVELKKAFGISEFSEEKTNKIYHLLEIIESLTPDAEKNYVVYSNLLNFLKMIDQNEDFNLISSVFKVKILSNLGYFSTGKFKNQRTKDVLSIFEKENFNVIKEKINLSQNSNLKLISILDSMIESLTQSKLRSSRFLNGQI